jgi:tetratricopeptide (TPR) repeat protein
MKNNRTALLAGLALVLAALAAYHNSFGVPFVFDDSAAISDNPTIRKLWPPWQALNPPATGAGVTGRPLVNYSLAVNYAIGGVDVRGYHAMNLALHVLVALTLWGVLRRTLRQPVLPKRISDHAELAAWTTALLWTVHPLLTESVVCVVQRNEIMGGFFYLLTLYGFIRATPSTTSASVSAHRGWLGVAVGACLLGMASKEIVATVPLMVLLYDRTFVAGTFREAWQRRKLFYGALAVTWLFLAWLMVHTGKRGGTVGFGLGVTSWEYLLTQCRALTTYLKLSFWPDPLVVDYGTTIARSIGEVWWRGLLVVALLVATIFALFRRPVLGFLGAWFFVILAPSSSFVPLTTQTLAEHRMYLPLIAVIALGVGAGTVFFGRRALVALVAMAVGAGCLTVRRNFDYQDEMTLWRDTVANQPENSRAISGLAAAYLNQGDLPAARRYYAEALRLDPKAPLKQYNMGFVLDQSGLKDEARVHYEEAIRLFPIFAPARANLAVILLQQGKSAEAVAQLEIAMQHLPHIPRVHYTHGLALLEQRKFSEAAKAFEQTLQLTPDNAEAAYNLGVALFHLNQIPDAIRHLQRAVQLAPELADAHFNFGVVLAASGRREDGMKHYAEAIRLDPNYAEAKLNLGVLLAQSGQLNEALVQLEGAVRLKPDSAEAHANFGNVLSETGHVQEAVKSYEQALRLRPGYTSAHFNLGNALLQLQRWKEAHAHFTEASRLAPDWADPKEVLKRMEAAGVGP